MSSLPEFAPTGHVLLRAPSILSEATAEGFLRAVDDALAWCPWLLVDMSAVERLDGSGLEALHSAFQAARTCHGGVVLMGLGDDAVRPAERALLVRLFPLYADLAAVPHLPLREPELPRQRDRSEQGASPPLD